MQTNNLILEQPVKKTSQQRITIKNDYLQKVKQRVAFVTIVIPFIGSVFAIALLRILDFGKVEIGLLVGMYALTTVGISVGFHRHFTHCTFKTNTTIRVILAILGSMAAQGPVIYWVKDHRRHHQYTDKLGDTHSPHIYKGKKFAYLHGLWYSHIGWMLSGEVTNSTLFVKDLLQDSAIIKVNRLYHVWVILGLVIPTFLGGIITATTSGALQGFLWGGLVRIFLGHHMIFSINSINHLYGSRPFDTQDTSTNNIWLAIPTGGEGWHNNHHAFPNSAKIGLSWWQVDPGYWVIHVLEKLGFIWDVKVPKDEMIEAKKYA